MADENESAGGPFLTKYRGWLMVFIVFVQVFVVCGPTYNYSILFVSLQGEFNAGAALTGWVGSLANGLFGTGSLFTSLLIQRLGPRVVTLLGAVVFSAGLVATSFVTALPYAYLTFGIPVGLGGNFVFHSGITLLFDWFPTKNCSRAFSLALLGTSFSVLAFAPLLNTLIATYGWRNALRFIAGGSLAVCTAHGVFIVTPAKTEREAHGPNLDGDHQVDTINEEDGNTETVQQKLGKMMRHVDIWLWTLCVILSFLGWTFVIVNYASFMEYDLHFTADQATVAIVLLAVGEIVGKILLSIFGDRIPCQKLYVVVVASILGAVVSGLMTVLREVPHVYAVSLFMGFFRAGSYAMPFPATMEIWGEYGSEAITVVSTLPYGIGVFIGAPLSGGLYDLTGDYTLSLLVIAAIFLTSAVLALIIPLRRRFQSSKYGFVFKPKSPTDISVIEVGSVSRNVPIACQSAFQT